MRLSVFTALLVAAAAPEVVHASPDATRSLAPSKLPNDAATSDVPKPEAAEARAGSPAANAPSAERTLWLVQPLFPGQESLVRRAEESLRSLIPDEELELVGSQRLLEAERDEVAVWECIFGDGSCHDPVDALAAGFGLERVLLLKVGQEAAGFRFRAVSFQPGVGEPQVAESSHPNWETALLGAIVRLAPITASLDVRSSPPGATVYWNDEEIGVTPLTTQVLPGRSSLRLELADHATFHTSQTVPFRGEVTIEQRLEKNPGLLRIVSPGAIIRLDGEDVGRDEVEVQVVPGAHRVELVRSGYEPHEEWVEVTAGETATLERDLAPGTWQAILLALEKAHTEIYSKKNYVTLTYDNFRLSGDRFKGQAVGNIDTKLEGMKGRTASDTRMHGIGLEYGSLWRFFGMSWGGLSYFRSGEDWLFEAQPGDLLPALPGLPSEPQEPFPVTSPVQGFQIRALQPQLRVALWRFVFGVRGGLVGRIGWVGDDDETFVFGDLGAEAMGSLQFHIYEGLFIEGGYGQTWTLVGSIDGTQEVRGGIGYAF